MNLKGTSAFFLLFMMASVAFSASVYAYPEFINSPENQCKRLLKKRDEARFAVIDCWNKHDKNRGELCKDLQAEADRLDNEYKRKCSVRNIRPIIPADDGVVPVF